MAKNFSLELERIIGQIKYRPNLSSLHGAPKVLHELESEFQEWKSEGNQVTLFTPDRNEFLQADPDTITAGKESDTHERDTMIDYVERVFNNSLEAFELKTIKRIGFRTTLIMKSEFEYSELVDLIYKKFYSPNNELKTISANDEIKDVVYILVGWMNGLKNRVQIGPTTSRESLANFAPNFPVKAELSDNNLFIDIDVSSTDVTTDTASQIFKDAAVENSRILNAYLELMERPL
jgi:hypothetical protein